MLSSANSMTKGPTRRSQMKAPADLYAPSSRAYEGLPEVEYPFHDSDILVTACGRICMQGRRSTSRPCSQVKGSESRKSTTAFGSSASCTMISDISTWNRGPCRPSTTRSARGCHPCLRYKLLPMSPGRTQSIWLGRQDSNLGMAVPKTAALPLGDAPAVRPRRKARRLICKLALKGNRGFCVLGDEV